MKKIGIINSSLSEVVANMGHTDMLTVCDAGFPIPLQTRRIDLALSKGQPSFADTLKVIALELHVERAILAEEAKTVNPQVEKIIKEVFPGIQIDFLPHDRVKVLSKESKAIVRTGEFTSYSNVILIAGVWGFK
jgi:D-ribose pyranase